MELANKSLTSCQIPDLPGIKKKKFDNGLTLLTERIRGSKKVIFMVVVRVGSANENDILSGGSHFNEHMAFKSNQHRTAKQITDDLEFLGTDSNAFTGRTMTAYYTKSLPQYISESVEVFYQALTNFKYDKQEFDREKKVILTEISMGIEDPGNNSFSNLFMPTIFTGTVFERTIDGTKESMGDVSREELIDFKKQFYVPNNIMVIVVGNFDQKQIEKQISNTFGKMHPGNIPYCNLSIKINNSRIEKIMPDKKVEQVYLNIGFKVPGHNSADVFKFILLNNILSGGMSSRMFQELREKRGIGYSVGSTYMSVGDAGILITYIDGFDPSRFEQAKSVILDQFEDLKTNLVSEREFIRAKNLKKSRHSDSMESIMSHARSIMNREIGQRPYDFRKIPEYIEKVTKEDIQEIAQKYLTDQFTLTALVPKEFKL